MANQSGPDLSGKGGPILGAERQRHILEAINRGEIVAIGEFAQRFDVSRETIRRDIRSLGKAGQLHRVHGGAAPMPTVDFTARRPIAERLEVDREARLLAAKASTALFEDEMSVYLGSSSTMLLVAEEIVRRGKRLTITTTMIDVATVTAASGLCEVTLLGGVVDPKRRCVDGYETLRSIESRLFDLCVFGASAISPIYGVLGTSIDTSVLVETVRSRSSRIAFVADGSKFGRRDSHVVLPLKDVDFLATDAPLPDEMAQALRKANVTVLLPEGVADNRLDSVSSAGA